MFELIKNGKKDYFNICVDGVTYLYSHVYYEKGEIHKPSQYVSKDRIVSQYLINCLLKDFGEFEYISLISVFDWVDFEHSLGFTNDYEVFGEYGKRVFKNTGKISVSFSFNPDLAKWKKAFGFLDYFENFESFFNHSEILQGKIRYFPEDGGGFEISIVLPKFNSTVSDFLSPYVNELKKIHERVITNLELSEYENSIISKFNFPEELKVSCEQYLLYFAQFLRDLGINATSNLKEESGKVLFTIKPNDDIEALDKIREALEVYLRLPSSQIVSNSQEIAIQRLESQVEYFRSQIRLAKAELQLKEATIQQQQVTIIKLGENVMIDSMVKNVTPAENKSEFLGGSVEVMTPKFLENYGVKKIDLDKFWKYMKEKFAKK